MTIHHWVVKSPQPHATQDVQPRMMDGRGVTADRDKTCKSVAVASVDVCWPLLGLKMQPREGMCQYWPSGQWTSLQAI